jgi:signal transduction histidine kinase
LLGTASHELREPLAVISMWTHVLRVPDCDAPTRIQAAEAIEASVRAQLRLIDAVLELSRLLAGVGRGKLASVPVMALLRAEVERARPAASLRGVSLEIADAGAASAASVVQGDAKHLSQVFESAIVTTIAFTQAGGRVVVSTSRRAAAVRIDVRGGEGGEAPGLDDASQTAPRGGLGMAIARATTALYGGTMQATTAGYVLSLPVAAGRRTLRRASR